MNKQRQVSAYLFQAEGEEHMNAVIKLEGYGGFLIWPAGVGDAENGQPHTMEEEFSIDYAEQLLQEAYEGKVALFAQCDFAIEPKGASDFERAINSIYPISEQLFKIHTALEEGELESLEKVKTTYPQQLETN